MTRFQKKFSDNKLIFVFFVLSFVLSLHLFLNKIDPDSFSYYYIGRGIVEGKDIFADFAANKGPVNFLFFALLDIIFRDNYLLAFVVASTVLDFLAVTFLYELVLMWFGKLTKESNFLFALFCILFYKFSFISLSSSGVFSETVSLPLVFSSLYFFGRINETFRRSCLFWRFW